MYLHENIAKVPKRTCQIDVTTFFVFYFLFVTEVLREKIFNQPIKYHHVNTMLSHVLYIKGEYTTILFYFFQNFNTALFCFLAVKQRAVFFRVSTRVRQQSKCIHIQLGATRFQGNQNRNQRNQGWETTSSKGTGLSKRDIY